MKKTLRLGVLLVALTSFLAVSCQNAASTGSGGGGTTPSTPSTPKSPFTPTGTLNDVIDYLGNFKSGEALISLFENFEGIITPPPASASVRATVLDPVEFYFDYDDNLDSVFGDLPTDTEGLFLYNKDGYKNGVDPIGYLVLDVSGKISGEVAVGKGITLTITDAERNPVSKSVIMGEWVLSDWDMRKKGASVDDQLKSIVGDGSSIASASMLTSITLSDVQKTVKIGGSDTKVNTLIGDVRMLNTVLKGSTGMVEREDGALVIWDTDGFLTGTNLPGYWTYDEKTGELKFALDWTYEAARIVIEATDTITLIGEDKILADVAAAKSEWGALTYIK